MESLLGKKEKEEKRGINKVLIVGILIGIFLIAGAVWLLSLRPPANEQMA